MLKQRVKLNAVANVFAQFVTAMTQLGTVPVFLHFWSTKSYGEWLLLYSIPSYFALADVGISSIAAAEASMFMAAGKIDDARKSIQTAFGLVLFVSISLTLVAALLCLFLPWHSIEALPGLTRRELSISIFLLTVYTAAGFFCTLYGANYRAALRAPRNTHINSIGRIGEFLAIVFVLMLNGGVIALSASLTGIRMLTLVFMYFDALKIAPMLPLGLADFSREELKRTIKPALLYMAFPVGNSIYFQGLTLVTGYILGPVAVVVFNTVRALTRAIVQFVTIIKYSIMPEFAHLFGQGDFERARKLNGLAFELALCSAVAISGFILWLGPWIMSVWTHEAVAVPRSLLALFLGASILNSLWSISSVLLIGTNRHGGVAGWYVFATLGAVLFSYILMPHFGIFGAAWSMVFCELMMVPVSIAKVGTVIAEPASRFIWSTLTLRRSREALIQPQRGNL